MLCSGQGRRHTFLWRQQAVSRRQLLHRHSSPPSAAFNLWCMYGTCTPRSSAPAILHLSTSSRHPYHNLRRLHQGDSCQKWPIYPGRSMLTLLWDPGRDYALQDQCTLTPKSDIKVKSPKSDGFFLSAARMLFLELANSLGTPGRFTNQEIAV